MGNRQWLAGEQTRIGGRARSTQKMRRLGRPCCGSTPNALGAGPWVGGSRRRGAHHARKGADAEEGAADRGLLQYVVLELREQVHSFPPRRHGCVGAGAGFGGSGVLSIVNATPKCCQSCVVLSSPCRPPHVAGKYPLVGKSSIRSLVYSRLVL